MPRFSAISTTMPAGVAITAARHSVPGPERPFVGKPKLLKLLYYSRQKDVEVFSQLYRELRRSKPSSNRASKATVLPRKRIRPQGQKPTWASPTQIQQQADIAGVNLPSAKLGARLHASFEGD